MTLSQQVYSHKVDFHEAATVLKDVLAMTFPDGDHSSREERFVTIGISDPL
jgi:uncharacterized DUF497 family protein